MPIAIQFQLWVTLEYVAHSPKVSNVLRFVVLLLFNLCDSLLQDIKLDVNVHVFFFSIYQAVSSFKSSIIYIWLGDPVTTTTRRNTYFFNWFNKFAIHISKNTLSSCKYKILNRQIGGQTKNKKLDKLSAQVGFGMLVSAQEQEWHGPSREKQWIWKITGYWMFFSTPLLPLQIWFPTLGSRFSGDR